MDEHGKIIVNMFHGFAHPCQLLDHRLLAISKVPVCHKNGFLIEVCYACIYC